MKKIKGIAIIIMLVLTMLIVYPVSAQGPNYMGFDTSITHTTIGDSPTVDVWVDVSSSIDTASVDNLTFLPAGIVNYTSTAKGDLFGGTIIWLTPEDNGVVNNASGYANYGITWSDDTPVNNTNGTLATITWLAYDVGTATLTITAGGTALGGFDPGTTKYPGTIVVHPEEPTGLIATPAGTTQIDLTWTKQTGMDKTLIRWRTDTNPTSPTDGTELYNGTGASTSHGGLSPGDHIYYSAWGWNDSGGLYSLLYDTDDAITAGGNIAPDMPELWLPSNNSDYESVYNQAFKVNVSDPNGDLMDVIFYWANHTLFDVVYSVSNGTTTVLVEDFLLPPWKDWLDHDTTYSWYVNVTDGEFINQSEVWSFTTSKAWDVNEDRIINYLDVSALVSIYGDSFLSGEYGGDINNDGIVNYLDVSSLVSHYGESY